MSKYIPKVGEAFEWKFDGIVKWSKARKVICITENDIGYESDTGYIVTISKQCMFRAIQIKSDVEREQLLTLLRDYVNAEIGVTVYIIQQAGFTIPKKIKRSDLLNQIKPYALISDGAKYAILNDICDFLGDLVEDEGGAE